MAARPGWISREATLYLVAQQFLTRLPSPELPYAPGDLGRAAKYFPLVGVTIGLLSGLIWALLITVLPPALAAGFALMSMILITGALHEDGFADCCDGLGGGASREKTLTIMRDSRIGVYGGVGLIGSIGLRWSGLSELDAASGLAAMIIAPVVGRMAMTGILCFGVYARPDGAARDVKDGVTKGGCMFALILAGVIVVCLGGLAGLCALAIALVATALWLRWLTYKLGGYTGDGLGASEQISQVIALAILAGFWA